jgi:hypothetical protein
MDACAGSPQTEQPAGRRPTSALHADLVRCREARAASDAIVGQDEDQIVAECDGYRAGFVAVFPKYEGQPTDDLDGQGRPLKVSRVTFARHLGISNVAFGRWVEKAEGSNSYSSPSTSNHSRDRLGSLTGLMRPLARARQVSVQCRASKRWSLTAGGSR